MPTSTIVRSHESRKLQGASAAYPSWPDIVRQSSKGWGDHSDLVKGSGSVFFSRDSHSSRCRVHIWILHKSLSLQDRPRVNTFPGFIHHHPGSILHWGSCHGKVREMEQGWKHRPPPELRTFAKPYICDASRVLYAVPYLTAPDREADDPGR